MKPLWVRFAVFGAVGMVGTVFHYATLIGLVQLAGWSALWASSLGALIGATTNYVLNYSVTFRSQQRHVVALPRFLAVAGIGLVLNSLAMASLLHLNVHFLLAQVLATLLVLVSGFLGNQYWAFREKT